MGFLDNNSYKRTDKIGPLEIDRANKVYRIHGANKAKGSSLVGGTAKTIGKAGLAMGTGGLSLIPSMVKKSKTILTGTHLKS